MKDSIEIFCECNSAACLRRFPVPRSEYVNPPNGKIFVSVDCPTPPEPGEVKIAEGEGYFIYQERESAKAEGNAENV